MASVVIAVLDPLEQFKKSSDARRKSDLAQVQRALEVYYNDFNEYPGSFNGKISTDSTANGVVDWGQTWKPYMDVLPTDPKRNYSYGYYSTGQSYALYASLERGTRDPQVCDVQPCTNSTGISCGGECNYGVSSPNISP